MLTDNIKEIFKDVKIIELSSVLAGPLVGTFFAELGAKVIKVENKNTGGDVTRNWYLREEEKTGKSAYYRSANYGKEVIFLNLNQKADRDELHAELEDTDIVLNNIKLSSAEKLGVHPRQLKEIKDDLIYAQLDGFDGDQNERPAYDVALQAETGFLSMTGQSEDKLAKMPVAFIDVLAAHQLKEALLIALLKKYKQDTGTFLRSSLYGTALTSHKNQATNYLLVNHIPCPMGTLHPNICPYGEILKFSDEVKIVLAVGSDRQFISLLEILDLTHLIKDDRFQDNASRLSNRADLFEILQEAAGRKRFEDVRHHFIEESVPYGRVLSLDEVWQKKVASPYINRKYGVPRQSAVKYCEINDIE